MNLISLKLTLIMCQSFNSNCKQYCTYCETVGVERKNESVFDFHETWQSAQRFSFYCYFHLTSRYMSINVCIELMKKALNNLEQNRKYFRCTSMANETCSD